MSELKFTIYVGIEKDGHEVFRSEPGVLLSARADLPAAQYQRVSQNLIDTILYFMNVDSENDDEEKSNREKYHADLREIADRACGKAPEFCEKVIDAGVEVKP